jgi:NAD-dependent dihydropyrimidine dehydrogenase PreA subunit
LGGEEKGKSMSMTMFHFTCDPLLCTDCGMCAVTLPQFISQHGGELTIPEADFYTEELQDALAKVIEVCPNNCISVELKTEETNELQLIWRTPFTIKIGRNYIII